VTFHLNSWPFLKFDVICLIAYVHTVRDLWMSDFIECRSTLGLRSAWLYTAHHIATTRIQRYGKYFFKRVIGNIKISHLYTDLKNANLRLRQK
jgi:hypothetical protein